MISFTAEDTHQGKNIVELLQETYPDFSQKELLDALKRGLITVNGEQAHRRVKLSAKDSIRIYLTSDAAGLALRPNIIYQDHNIVIADKPAGLASVSDTGPSAISMVEEIMRQRGEYSLQALMVPYIIYPLEKYVSGLLILAKHESVYLFLAEAIAQRRIARHYVCAVAGKAKEKDELLAYHLHKKSKTSVRILKNQNKYAKPIVTRYRSLALGDELSLICARPITNYMHQVRAHLAFEKLPVIGDSVYGSERINKRLKSDHIALWLKTLVFETGTSHEYAYLNGKTFESSYHSFPKCVYDAGLLEAH